MLVGIFAGFSAETRRRAEVRARDLRQQRGGIFRGASGLVVSQAQLGLRVQCDQEDLLTRSR